MLGKIWGEVKEKIRSRYDHFHCIHERDFQIMNFQNIENKLNK